MPNLLKKLRISSVDLCRRGANPLAKIALSKSDDEQWRTRLKELADDTDAPLTDIADELRAIAAKIGQSAEENAEDEEVVRQHEAVVAKQYAAVCDENELTKRLVQMRAAGGGAALLLRGSAARRRLRLVGHRPAILHMVLYICARAVGPAVIRGRHGTAPFR